MAPEAHTSWGASSRRRSRSKTRPKLPSLSSQRHGGRESPIGLIIPDSGPGAPPARAEPCSWSHTAAPPARLFLSRESCASLNRHILAVQFYSAEIENHFTSTGMVRKGGIRPIVRRWIGSSCQAGLGIRAVDAVVMTERNRGRARRTHSRLTFRILCCSL